jgi:hypothetical protein
VKRNSQKLFKTAAALSLGLLGTPLLADSHGGPHVADLAWMTGSWAGPAGPDRTLEENWIEPTGGSIASLVRITTADATPMVELIVIEEEADTLMLRIQQWDPGFAPRTAGPQVMKLAELGERRVRFEATAEDGLRALTYSSPTPDSFNIDVETPTGDVMQLKLKAR